MERKCADCIKADVCEHITKYIELKDKIRDIVGESAMFEAPVECKRFSINRLSVRNGEGIGAPYNN